MKKFIIEFKTNQVHRVEIGVEAEEKEGAMKQANAWLAEGSEDTDEVLVLSEEVAEGERSATCKGGFYDFPEPDLSAEARDREKAAHMTCRIVADVLEGVAAGRRPDMRELATALAAATYALRGKPRNDPERTKRRENQKAVAATNLGKL